MQIDAKQHNILILYQLYIIRQISVLQNGHTGRSLCNLYDKNSLWNKGKNSPKVYTLCTQIGAVS